MRPFEQHLNKVEDLRTSREATRAGFVAFALERSRRGTPFVQEGVALRAAASTVAAPADLTAVAGIEAALVYAAGVSGKAGKFLNQEDKDAAVAELIKAHLGPAGSEFVDELVYRYLLTKGDTLGGIMRNIVGTFAEFRWTRALLANLALRGAGYRWKQKGSKNWLDQPADDTGIEFNLTALAWLNDRGDRTLVRNQNLPMVGNNVDICLFACPPGAFSRKVLADPGRCLALGELKGGIDPAGADEHWKTARTAFVRINAGFAKEKVRPHTFFVGAAIEAAMSNEIWEMLQSGQIENACNLTVDDQLSSVARWLLDL